MSDVEPANDQGEPETLARENVRLKREAEAMRSKILMLQGNIKAMSDFLNNGAHAARKKRKKGASDDVDTCLAVMDSVLLSSVWTKRKFLPKNWKEWKPENDKSTSSVLIGYVEKNLPICLTPDVFWHVYATEMIGKWFVSKRNADTSRMKGLHARKYN